MKNINLYHRKVIYVVTVFSILCAASGLRAEERQPAADALTEGTKAFLSDRARTGSLVGSILAGAAVANPLAPLLGSVAGFVIGKSSAFTDKEARGSSSVKRSLIPEEGLAVTSLTGLTGKPAQTQLEAPEQIVIVGMSEESVIEDRPEQTIIVGMPEESGLEDQSARTGQEVTLGLTGNTAVASEIQKQLAYACSNVQVEQPLSLSCYYYSQ